MLPKSHLDFASFVASVDSFTSVMHTRGLGNLNFPTRLIKAQSSLSHHYLRGILKLLPSKVKL